MEFFILFMLIIIVWNLKQGFLRLEEKLEKIYNLLEQAQSHNKK